jgi:threonine dehydrogenase-like Zn-dependent dehydrogenase
MIKSLWHTPRFTEIRHSKLPIIVDSKIKIISKYSMISLGTESLVLRKQVPKTISDYMTVPYMGGNFNLPIKYGYALSGILESGKKGHLMHPHQNTCFVEQQSIFQDCQELPLRRIPLISNIETVINAIWDADLDKEKTIVISGFGNIGSLLAFTLKYHYNLDVKIIETNLWRKQKAIELGLRVYDNNNGFDIAFNTAASEKALQFCIDHANEEGQIIDLSWYGISESTLKLGGNFHKNRLRLIASQVSKIPIKKRKEFNFQKRKLLAVDILKNDVFDQLLTNIILFDDAPNFFDSVRNNSIPNGLIYLIKY